MEIWAGAWTPAARELFTPSAVELVARLHRKIGTCELTSVEFLSDDRLVQATTFSNGTRIVANLSEEPRDVENLGLLGECQWQAM